MADFKTGDRVTIASLNEADPNETALLKLGYKGKSGVVLEITGGAIRIQVDGDKSPFIDVPVGCLQRASVEASLVQWSTGLPPH